jgi:hypothetical protein
MLAIMVMVLVVMMIVLVVMMVVVKEVTRGSLEVSPASW